MTRPLPTFIFAMLLLLGSTGCIYSEDRDVYTSTYMSPKTAYVVDVATGETIWSYDIPPQHILVVEREVGSGMLESVRTERGYPTRIEWELHTIDAGRSLLRQGHYRGTPLETGTLQLPGHPIRVGFTIGDPIDPSAITAPRTIEQIERDLPEPSGSSDAADDFEESLEDDVMGEDDAEDAMNE